MNDPHLVVQWKFPAQQRKATEVKMWRTGSIVVVVVVVERTD